MYGLQVARPWLDLAKKSLLPLVQCLSHLTKTQALDGLHGGLLCLLPPLSLPAALIPMARGVVVEGNGREGTTNLVLVPK